MEVEQYERWEPLEGITTPVGCALIKEDQKGLQVTLLFFDVLEGVERNLRIKFGRVPAYTVHEEFVHPWNMYEKGPTPELLTGKWEKYCFPLLIVKNSLWLATFSDSQIMNYPGSTHYRLVTLDQTVDVICNRMPQVDWIGAETTDKGE